MKITVINGSAQKDVKTSLRRTGVSMVCCGGAGMMGDIFRNTVTDAHATMPARKTERLYRRITPIKALAHTSPVVAAPFYVQAHARHGPPG